MSKILWGNTFFVSSHCMVHPKKSAKLSTIWAVREVNISSKSILTYWWKFLAARWTLCLTIVLEFGNLPATHNVLIQSREKLYQANLFSPSTLFVESHTWEDKKDESFGVLKAFMQKPNRLTITCISVLWCRKLNAWPHR